MVYGEIYKIGSKNSTRKEINGRQSVFTGIKTLASWCRFPQLALWISIIPIKVPETHFEDASKMTGNFIWTSQRLISSSAKDSEYQYQDRETNGRLAFLIHCKDTHSWGVDGGLDGEKDGKGVGGGEGGGTVIGTYNEKEFKWKRHSKLRCTGLRKELVSD